MAIRLIREGHVTWQGTVAKGGGTIAVGSGAFQGPFTAKAREQDTPNTNPEELIGAAHAGCFTMSLANQLSRAGHPPANLETTARVHLEQVDGGFSITRIELDTEGEVPDVDDETFERMAEQAKATCPVSRALAGTEISLRARLATAS